MPSLLENMPECFEGNHEEFWSYEKYVSALEVWISYAMTVKPLHYTGAETIDVLSPIGYFCNHGIYPHYVHYSQLRLSDENLVFPAVRDVAKNQEIMLSYGAKMNAELLLFYGFCLADNPYDALDITLDFESLNGVEELNVRRRREKLLEKHGLTLNHAIQKNAELPRDLVATIRILCCEEKLVFLYDGDPRVREISMLSEAKASDALFTALTSVKDAMLEKKKSEVQKEQEQQHAWCLKQCRIYESGLMSVIDSALEQTAIWRQNSSLAEKN